METNKKVLYTAKVSTTGGRTNGTAKSNDGQLDIKLSTPGTSRPGTNPEQLFAAGWSACFEGALGVAAKQLNIALPDDTTINAEIDLTLSPADGYALQARLNISIPGVEHEIAQQLVDAAHQTCPYSKAIRGDVDVEINLI